MNSRFFVLGALALLSQTQALALVAIAPQPFEEAIGIKDRVDTFVGPGFYQPLTNIEAVVPMNGKSKEQPWSGTYWPLYLGGPAAPYADQGMFAFKHKQFHDNYNNFKDRIRDLTKNANKHSFSDKDLDKLSPTEKYDLYVGDGSFALTQNVWQSLDESDHGREKNQHIKDWEGMCHGWSPAAAYTSRPTHPITVNSLDGRYKLNFYPDDLKALDTLLWANSLVQDDTLVEGLRCKTNFPVRDQASGKTLTTRCKGVNPGVFHMSVLGLIGAKQTPFIINQDNDEEVWNQPAFAYSFHYFNVQNDQQGNVQSSAVLLSQFADPFKAFRSPRSKYLVGVDMTLKFVSETDPSHQQHDGPENDIVQDLHMRYDLELDEQYNVIGGEWIDDQGAYGANNNALPNYPAFMWRFHSDNPFASSIVDAKLDSLSALAVNSSYLVPLSQQASSFRYTRFQIDEDGDVDHLVLDEHGQPIVAGHELRPQPIALVVNQLLNLAK